MEALRDATVAAAPLRGKDGLRRLARGADTLQRALCADGSRSAESPLFLAHVRATSGTAVQQSNCHPFRRRRPESAALIVRRGRSHELRPFAAAARLSAQVSVRKRRI